MKIRFLADSTYTLFNFKLYLCPSISQKSRHERQPILQHTSASSCLTGKITGVFIPHILSNIIDMPFL